MLLLLHCWLLIKLLIPHVVVSLVAFVLLLLILFLLLKFCVAFVVDVVFLLAAVVIFKIYCKLTPILLARRLPGE